MKKKTIKTNSRCFFDFKQLVKKLNKFLILLFIFLLPTQLGKHFFFDFSYLFGVRTDYLAPTIYLSDIIFFCLLFINLKKIKFLFSNKKFLIISLMMLINFFVSINKWLGFYYILRVYQLIFLYFIFKKNQPDKKNFALVFLFSTLVQFFLVLFQLINHGSIQGIFYFLGERFYHSGLPGIAKVSFNGKEIVRPYGTFSHPNSLGGFYLLCYFFLIESKIFDKFFLIKNLLFFLFSFLVFFSFSKTAILVFFILNIFYFLKKLKNCRLCFFSRLLVFFVLFIIFINFQGGRLSLKNRIILIKNSFLVISQHPIFGTGLGNYLLGQNKINQPSYYSLINQPVHNIFLLFYAQAGVLSLVGFFLFKKEVFLKIKKKPCFFLVIFLTGMFDHYWLTLIQNQLLPIVLVSFL